MTARPFNRSPARMRGLFLSLPLALLIGLLLLYPLTTLFWGSVASAGAISIHSYIELFRDDYYRTALLHSLLLSAVVAFISTFLCLAPAWLFANEEFAGKRLVRALYTLPMSFSGIIVGFLAVIMLGRIGVVPQLFEKATGSNYLSGSAYQLVGLVLAYLYFEIPRATLTLESALRKFDPQLSLAARSLGAGITQRICLVILPLIWRPLVSTFAVTLTVSLGSFGVALIISKRFSLLPLEIYRAITGYGNKSMMAAMVITLVLLAFIINYSVRNWTLGATEKA